MRRRPGALLDLHTGGYLDVSQRPNRAQMSAVTVTPEPPPNCWAC